MEKFDLKRKAEELGAEVFLIGGSEPVDVAEVARTAVAGGADLLGVAGGDGTQALVAGVAAEHGIPFMVIAAGTRNHFALDLGLDRDNPATCLDALSDGVELRVDLGVIGGQTFVNNVSFGAYAEIVETPAYRGDKLHTTLNMLPDLLQGHRGTPVRGPGRRRGNQGTAGAAGGQQSVRHRRYRGTGPSCPAGSRRARGGRSKSEQRAAGGWPAARRTRRRAERAECREGRDHRRRTAGPDWHRRRGRLDAHAGRVHDPPGCPPRSRAPQSPGSPSA